MGSMVSFVVVIDVAVVIIVTEVALYQITFRFSNFVGFVMIIHTLVGVCAIMTTVFVAMLNMHPILLCHVGFDVRKFVHFRHVAIMVVIGGVIYHDVDLLATVLDLGIALLFGVVGPLADTFLMLVRFQFGHLSYKILGHPRWKLLFPPIWRGHL